VFEPVQGESGFIVPSQEFVEGLREICDANGIVMVADEVQTGSAARARSSPWSTSASSRI
jgi:4-aminobutyrate aminotransferase-like enzyme